MHATSPAFSAENMSVSRQFALHWRNSSWGSECCIIYSLLLAGLDYQNWLVDISLLAIYINNYKAKTPVSRLIFQKLSRSKSSSRTDYDTISFFLNCLLGIIGNVSATFWFRPSGVNPFSPALVTPSVGKKSDSFLFGEKDASTEDRIPPLMPLLTKELF